MHTSHNDDESHCNVAIVGGFTGTVLATQLLKHNRSLPSLGEAGARPSGVGISI